MWTVQFNEYLSWEGVREGIKEVKLASKNEQNRFGYQVEETMLNILSQHQGLTVKDLPAQMDIGFGADALVSYVKDDKNYSFYLDVTAKQKDRINYFSATGSTTLDVNKAFVYETEYFKLRFGIKEQHACHFFYDKPVIVAYVEHFIPCTGIAVTHLNNIQALLVSLNEMLFDMGFGARASKKIRPNLNRFRKEYVEGYVAPNDLWGDYFYNLFYKANIKGGK